METSPISSSSFAVIFGNRLRIRDDIAQRSEQLAIGSGRPARGALLARLARERAQALGVDARMGVDQRADRAVVLQQFLAPALDPVNSRGLFGRDPVPDPQLLSDRFRIREKLRVWDGVSTEETARVHRIERWREKLLENDGAIGALVHAHPRIDTQRLRALVRN